MTHKPQRATLMYKHDDNDWSDQWMHQIGWIGYHFAQLEWASFWLAEEIADGSHRTSIAKLAFAKRCDEVRRKVVPLIEDPSLRRAWKELFKRMVAAADMRNKILHNPLEIRSDVMLNKGITVDQGILLMRERGRRVLIGDVQHFTDGLIDLHGEMVALMKRTRGEE